MCIRRRHLLWLFSLLLAGCGGGGGGGGGGNTNAWTMGVFPPATNFDAKCVSPRSGTDPATGRAFPDVPGTATDEKMWLRSWTNDLYLWYSEVPDLDPASYTTPQYFDVLMTPAVTPSGNPKDKFHFTLSSAEWFALSAVGSVGGLRRPVGPAFHDATTTCGSGVHRSEFTGRTAGSSTEAFARHGDPDGRRRRPCQRQRSAASIRSTRDSFRRRLAKRTTSRCKMSGRKQRA